MIYAINTIAQCWWSWMGAMFWQVSLLILIVSFIDMLIRSWAWPQVRYALWMLVVIKLLIPPTWSASLSPISRIHPWAQERIGVQWKGQADTNEVKAIPEATEKSTIPATSGDAALKGATEPVEGRAGFVWQVYAVALWVLGMLLFLVLLLRRIATLRRWHREQDERQTIPEWFHNLLVETAQRLKLGRVPAIVFNRDAVTPAVYGVFRPVLLLPARYIDNLSREEAEHILLHELAHLKRGDLTLNGLCLLLQIVYWFNPFIIWSRREMKHVREMCCDLTIANILREKTMRYRKTLLNTARELLTESLEPGMGLLGVFEEPFRLVARLKWLEKKTWQYRRLTQLAVCGVLIVAIPCLLPMAAARMQAQGGGESVAEAAGGHSAQTSSTDVYYKEVVRADTYLLGIKTDSEVQAQTETWFGETAAVRDMGSRKIIVDIAEGKFTFVNRTTESYVEAPLPLDFSKLIAQESFWRRGRNTYSGVVEATGKTSTVMGNKCDGYHVTFWQVSADNRENFAEVKVWSTTDLNYNLAALYELQDIFRRLVKRDEKVRSELKKIEGIQMKNEHTLKGLFWKKRVVEEVVEINELKAPEGTYSVPFGYVRKEVLDDRDLAF